MSSPADVLAACVRSDATRPRLTTYDDTDGPTRGERIELSARVIATWVAKAGSLLQEELDVAPGSVVRLALPPHWRTVYWAYAVWSVGGCIALDDSPADVVVTDDPALARAGGPAVLVTLPALARAAVVPVPAGAIDEASEVASYPDVLDVWEQPAGSDPALRAAAGTTAYDELRGADVPAGARVHTASGDVETMLRLTLGAWAGDGSVVLSRGRPADGGALAARLRTEAVSLDFPASS